MKNFLRKGSPGMRIVAAPDSFKGSLSASKAAESMERGIKRVLPAAGVVRVPLSDGGEGLVDSLVGSTGGSILQKVVTGPLGRPVEAFWGLLGDNRTAVIEMAAASGLPLVPEEERNPLITTTYGTGELIKAALDAGCPRLIIGIGGSATNDGGAGMAQALGVGLRDSRGRELPFGGGSLSRLAKIDTSGLEPRLKGVEILVASDVDNPLTGPRGASRIYGPQKGAAPEMVEELDKALKHYSLVIEQYLGLEVDGRPGSGAAGGLGAGLMAFLGGRLKPGIELVMEAVGFAGHLKGCDLVLTGEGKIDAQSAFGKVPVGVAREAKKRGLPVVALAGSVERSREMERVYREGVTACFSIVKGPMTLKEAMAQADLLVEEAAAEVMRLWVSIKPGTEGYAFETR